MAQLEPYRSEIESAGALAYIAAERRSGMFKPEQYLVEHPISFPFLLDEDRRVTRAYGVYHRLGKDAIQIARPATFVAGRNGRIQYAFVASHQAERSPMAEVLAALRQAKELGEPS
jgi:peroxiredoxin